MSTPTPEKKEFRCDPSNPACSRVRVLGRLCDMGDYRHAVELSEQPYTQTDEDRGRSAYLQSIHTGDSDYVGPSTCDFLNACNKIASDFSRRYLTPKAPGALGLGMAALSNLPPRTPGSGQA